jgi:site-specific DNA recombinase
MTTIPVAIYVRLSQDDGISSALDRQEKACRELAEKEGWTVVRVYSDNDISAYSGKTRPEFQQMLSDVRMGAYGGVITWKLDRFMRGFRALTDLTEACDASKTFYRTVEGNIDSRVEGSIMMVALVAAMGLSESKNISVRQRAKQKELREQGKPHGGGRRPYGHSKSWSEVIPDEAAILKEASGRILAGEAIRSVCRDLNTRKIKTANNARWSPIALREMLRSYRLAGAIENDGELVITGAVAPILDLETVERLRSVLTARGNGKRSMGRYLLSGMVKCGRCGYTMQTKYKGDGRRCFKCVPDGGGCGSMLVRADNLEEHVLKLFIASLNTSDWNETAKGTILSERANLVTQIAADKATAERLTDDHYVNDLMDRATFLRALEPLRERQKANEAKLAKTSAAVVIDDLMGISLEGFRELPIGRQRAVISAVIGQVQIQPVTAGTNKFNPERVNVIWLA